MSLPIPSADLERRIRVLVQRVQLTTLGAQIIAQHERERHTHERIGRQDVKRHTQPESLN